MLKSKSKWLLTIMIYALAQEPLIANGNRTSASVKSYRTKMRAINRQLIATSDTILGRPLNGRKRLELLESLEDDLYISNNDANLPKPYRHLRELLESLEDDAMAVQNQRMGAKKNFRLTVQTSKKAINAMNEALGVSRVGKRSIVNRKANLK